MPEAISPAAEPQKSLGEAIAAKLAAEVPATPAAAVTPEVVATEPVVTQPTAKSLADRARELGFADVKDDEDAAERLFAALQDRERQAAEAAERAKQFEQLALMRAQQAAQLPPPPATSPQLQQQDQYGALKIDEERVQEFYDQTAKNWREGTPEDVKRSFASYEKARKERLAAIVDNPREFLEPLLREFFGKGLEEHAAVLESQTEEQAIKTQFLANATWLYQVDPVTKTPRVDPRTGQNLLTPEGARFGEYMDEAAALGVTSLKGQLRYAERLRAAEQQSTQATQQATSQQAQQANSQHKQDLLKRALPGPSQAGTFPAPTERRSQNRSQSLGEKVLAEMQRSGVFAP